MKSKPKVFSIDYHISSEIMDDRYDPKSYEEYSKRDSLLKLGEVVMKKYAEETVVYRCYQMDQVSDFTTLKLLKSEARKQGIKNPKYHKVVRYTFRMP